ncbi:FAD-binding oxidoreductase, partial [Bacillus sp. SIMBA_069]
EFKAKEVNQIIAQGEFVGTSHRLKQLLKPLTKTGSPTNVMIKEVPYIEAVGFFNDPSGNRPAHRKRSGSFIEKTFPQRAILTMKHFLENA